MEIRTNKWISADAMRTELHVARSTISPSQIERWRREGLLPRPRQIGRGRGQGSIVAVLAASAAQALEIQRLFKIREKKDWVGWQLWLRDYAVDERYWRPALKRARAILRNVRDAARTYRNATQDREVDLSQLRKNVLTIVSGAPLHSPLRLLNPEMLETLVGFGIEVLLGEFGGFSRDEDGQAELAAISAMVGTQAADRSIVSGHQIDFAARIEIVLRDTSTGLQKLSRKRVLAEPSSSSREEFISVLEIASMLYRSLTPIFGRSALGLRTFHRIAAKPAIDMEAVMLLSWMALRDMSDSLLTRLEIREMREAALTLAKSARKWREQFEGASPNIQKYLVLNFKVIARNLEYN